MELINRTPFTAGRFVYLDTTCREVLVVIVKATFALRRGVTAIADEQVPLFMEDEYRDEPDRSSLSHASDLAPFKQTTDILLKGFAYPKAPSRTEVLVALRVGKLSKGARVIGDRVWDTLLGVTTLSSPQPFDRMPLIYERAFGGTDASNQAHPERCEENPVGIGFRSKRSRLPMKGARLPNIEAPTAPIQSPTDRPSTWGFGPVAPHWSPRARFVGTYDEAWTQERFPLLPVDFDERFHQVAPADQLSLSYVQGSEPLKVVGATPEGVLEASLPSWKPEIVVRVGAARETPPSPCDTVLIDCEQRLLTLVWRARLVIHGRVPSVQWIKVQPAGGRHAG